jgi:hypothetical protein
MYKFNTLCIAKEAVLLHFKLNELKSTGKHWCDDLSDLYSLLSMEPESALTVSVQGLVSDRRV